MENEIVCFWFFIFKKGLIKNIKNLHYHCFHKYCLQVIREQVYIQKNSDFLLSDPKFSDIFLPYFRTNFVCLTQMLLKEKQTFKKL